MVSDFSHVIYHSEPNLVQIRHQVAAGEYCYTFFALTALQDGQLDTAPAQKACKLSMDGLSLYKGLYFHYHNLTYMLYDSFCKMLGKDS